MCVCACVCARARVHAYVRVAVPKYSGDNRLLIERYAPHPVVAGPPVVPMPRPECVCTIKLVTTCPSQAIIYLVSE